MTQQEFNNLILSIADKAGIRADDEILTSAMNKLFIITDDGLVVPHNQHKPIVIYLIRNPIDNSIFYIGRTTMSLNKRLVFHICNPTNGNKKKAIIIKNILSMGQRPIMEKIEEFKPMFITEYRGVHPREQYWIDHYINAGEPITNRVNYIKGSFEEM